MAQQKTRSIPSLRAILSRFLRAPTRVDEAPEEVRPLLERLRRQHPKADLELVVRAYQVAEEVHDGQMRRSGDAYITHPLAVASILAEMGMDATTIACALLHDAIEDTDASLDELRQSFGEEASEIIDGLTKIASIGFTSAETQQAENYRKMMVAMARDVRVIIIKLADRLHNMRTLEYLDPSKQEVKARETLEIYVPLCARLGMYEMRVELEDLAFRYLYPKRYEEIVELTERRQPERDEYIDGVAGELEAHFDQAKIDAAVSGRAKNYYSIYQKMVERGRDFNEIYDLVGFRVVVEDLRDCYAALGVVHAMWKPIPGRFKDYIAMPKFNMYQSLHTAVIGPEGKPLEIQIRTREMHNTAEYGIAAHWRYKEGGGKQTRPDSDVPWLGEVVEVYREAHDPREFMESLRLDLFHDEVFCFTPKGDVVCLPRGATPIDFAYAIHTEVGHRTMGAKVNGRLVPLETRLESGDKVEVLTTKAQDARPKEDWLTFVKTSRARSRVRHWLTAHRREEAREAGQELFTKLLRKEGVPEKKLDDGAWRRIFSETKTSGAEKLYEALGEGRLPTEDLVGVLRKLFRPAEPVPAPEPSPPLRQRPVREIPSVVVTEATGEVAVRLSRCCTPVPGDEIFGFVTRGKGVSVHRANCPNADDLTSKPERIVDVAWDASQGGTFTVSLEAAAIDRVGLLRDITDSLTDHGVMIRSSSSWAKRDGTARLRFVFELGDVTHLDEILRAAGSVEGVFDVHRVLPGQARSGI